jgi:hypothetical protein
MSHRTRQQHATDSHCPFLNAAEPRCSAHFSLGSLEHAFDYCLGHFTACPLFDAMREQHRSRRMARLVGGSSEGVDTHEAHRRPVVTLHVKAAKVAAAHAQPLAADAGVSAVSRL